MSALLEALVAALRDISVDVELSSLRQQRTSLRIAEGAITEATSAVSTQTRVRVAIGSRVGSGLVGADEPAALRAAIEDAKARAERAAPLLFFDGWAESNSSAGASPSPNEPGESIEACASLAGAALREARSASIVLAGHVELLAEERAVATTRGVRASASTQAAALALQAHAGDPQVTARRASIVEHALDPTPLVAALASDLALDDALTELQPGLHDVVLGPAAVAELIEWLALIGLGARAVLDGESFLHRLGEIDAPWLELVDDPRAFGALAFGVDAEGTPARALSLIAAGRAAGCAHDRASAAEARARGLPFGLAASTGHAAPIVDELGDDAPLPRALVLRPGELDDRGLYAGVDDGLYVPHLHYVNGLSDPPHAVMTGLTRHGPRRIAGGKLGARVRDLRFGDSILAALGRVDGVGESATTLRGSLGLLRCPALRLRALRFTDHSG